MTRFLSAAGVAVYLAAVSTAFPSVQAAGASLLALVPAAVAAEAGGAGTEAADAGKAKAAESARVASTASTWDTDRDGLLMDEGSSAGPFDVLSRI